MRIINFGTKILDGPGGYMADFIEENWYAALKCTGYHY